jgi:UDP-N-acetylmuramoyl-tripeptide--D-alanyl-D-alanine ligase
MQISALYKIFEQYPSVTTDSRKIHEGVLYFALKGDKFDGNVFAKDALDKGAAFAIIDSPQYKSGDRMILVDDTLATLQALANFHRRQLNIPVLAITGTNGKTTTKELVKAVISRKYNVLATEGNLNNHIGVPLTLLSVKASHNFAIIEMGANHPNEIEALCRIAEPTYGLITNIGKAHLEGFGGFEGVKKTKKELYDFLEAQRGVIFYNADNEILRSILAQFTTRKISYGLHNGDVCSGKLTTFDPFLCAHIECSDSTSFELNTQLIGNYNFENILAAVAIGKYFEVANESIVEAIGNYKPVNNRSQLTHTPNNKLFVDCYNANPSSTELSLLNFFEVKASAKLVILGDMLELGDEAENEHRKMIELLVSNKCKAILVGPVYHKLAQQYGITSFENVAELNNYLEGHRPKEYTILIKGSRGIQLEKAIDKL